MTDSDERPETWRPVPEIDGCTFSGYEASDKGGYRSVDRTIGARRYAGKDLSTRAHKDGYRLVDIRCDSTDPAHKRAHTFAAHKVTLFTFAGPPGPGQEACHSNRGPAFNWWPEGVRWDTKPANHADQVAAGTARHPLSFTCVTAHCENKVRTEGRRCLPCVKQVGRLAAEMLQARKPKSLAEVAATFGNSEQWILRLATEYGGYTGTPAQARAGTTHRSWLRRVIAAAFGRGDAA